MTAGAASEAAEQRVWLWRIWMYAALYAAALLFANYRTGFHVGLNDFWGNYYQAENLRLSDANTLYDGFFPIGYPVLLRSVPVDDLIAAGFLIAAGARVMFFGIFGSLMLLLAPGPWALLATIALSLVPRMFQHVLTPAADIPMLIPLVAGGALLLRAVVREESARQRAVSMIAGGALLGLAGLFRQHSLAMALGLMIGCVAVRPRLIAWIFLSGLACTVAYAPQMLVSVLSGHGSLETAQYVNIYKMTHGVELRDIPLDVPHDLREIVSEDPRRFFRSWGLHVASMAPLLLSPIAAACWPGDPAMRRLGRAATIAGALYLAASALGWSHRAVLPVLPLTVGLAGALAYRLHDYVARRDADAGRHLIAVGAIVLVASGVLASNRNARLVAYYLAEHDRFAQVEEFVAATGAVHPKQVYTTDGSLYLPLIPPHFPYFDGTWGLFSLYDYAERYPRLDTSSADAFRRDCVREGVTHIVLGANAPDVSPTLGAMRESPDTVAGFRFLGEIAGYVVLKRV